MNREIFRGRKGKGITARPQVAGEVILALRIAGEGGIGHDNQWEAFIQDMVCMRRHVPSNASQDDDDSQKCWQCAPNPSNPGQSLVITVHVINLA